MDFKRAYKVYCAGAKLKQIERAGLHVIFYYYSACLYFTSDNVPDGIN
jgi:hypothetical protein